MSNSCFSYITLFFKVLLYFILFMSFDFERFSFITDVKSTPVCRDSNVIVFLCKQYYWIPSPQFQISWIIPWVWFYYSWVVPAYIFSDFVLCSSMLESNIFCSQLLNEQHNNDCHFPRANKLKCVIYTSQTTLNGIAICLFEKHRALMAFLSQQSTKIFVQFHLVQKLHISFNQVHLCESYVCVWKENLLLNTIFKHSIQ